MINKVNKRTRFSFSEEELITVIKNHLISKGKFLPVGEEFLLGLEHRYGAVCEPAKVTLIIDEKDE